MATATKRLDFRAPIRLSLASVALSLVVAPPVPAAGGPRASGVEWDAATRRTGSVTARAETAPVPNGGDAADDPAIWAHPEDDWLSLVIGTDKRGGLGVYDLRGRQRQFLRGIKPNNVDVRGDILAASDRASDTILVYRVDRDSRRLRSVRAHARDTGFGVAGLCMYRGAGGRLYVFVTDSSGSVKQFRLWRTTTGRYDYRPVRTLRVSRDAVEGCVADDHHRAVYFSDEDRAIWRYGAEPGAGRSRTRVDSVASARLRADIEGLAIVTLGSGRGYLIASSQGDDSFAVYDRRSHAYRGRFRIRAGVVDGTSHTDGIDASAAAGIFVAQDDRNPGGNQNFKIVSWRLIARTLGLRG